MGRALFASGVLMMISNLLFAALAATGHSNLMLALAVGTENLTSGIGLTVFVTYLSGLSSLAYTATQFALLSSFAAVGRTRLSTPSGYLAESLGWVGFWLFTVVAASGLILLWILCSVDLSSNRSASRERRTTSLVRQRSVEGQQLARQIERAEHEHPRAGLRSAVMSDRLARDRAASPMLSARCANSCGGRHSCPRSAGQHFLRNPLNGPKRASGILALEAGEQQHERQSVAPMFLGIVGDQPRRARIMAAVDPARFPSAACRTAGPLTSCWAAPANAPSPSPR